MVATRMHVENLKNPTLLCTRAFGLLGYQAQSLSSRTVNLTGA